MSRGRVAKPAGPHVQHLRTKAQFQAVMSGPTAAKTPHFVLHLLPAHSAAAAPALTTQALPCMGVVLPKRWARRAVTRNTIRRQIYELARTLAPHLPPAAMVVRLRREFARQHFVSATSVALKLAVRTELLALYHQVAPAPTPAPALASGTKATHAG